MKYHRLLFFAVILLPILSRSGWAENEQGGASDQTVNELLALINVDKMADNAIKQMFNQAAQGIPRVVQVNYANAVLQDPKLRAMSKEQHDKLQPIVEEFAKKIFTEFTIEFEKRVDIKKYLRETSSRLYKKYLTDAEVKDLIAFYKTPTGKKMLEVLPRISADALSGMQETVLPQVNAIIRETVSKEQPAFLNRAEQVLTEANQPAH